MGRETGVGGWKERRKDIERWEGKKRKKNDRKKSEVKDKMLMR